MDKKTEIKAIIFDVGGVLVQTDWNGIADEMLKKHNFSTKIWSDYPKSMHKHYKGLSIGKISLKKVFKILSGKQNIRQILIDYEKAHKNNKYINMILIKKLRKLKKFYKLYCLTNISDVHYQFHKKEGIYKNFIKTYASCNTGIKKPNKKCFQLILKEQHLVPSETVFIDDYKENVIAAKSLGINGIIFKNNKQLVRDLRTLGVKI